MGISDFVGLATLVVLSLAHHALADTQYGVYTYDGNQNINSPQIMVTLYLYGGPGGSCQYKVVGRGVDDTISEECPNYNDWNQINIENYYTYYYPNYSPLGLYTDTTGTLVIIKSTGCTLRKYKTTSKKVTHTESVLSTAVCNKIKMRIYNQMVEINDYWAKWEINFHRSMYGLPPVYYIVDPLVNQPRTASLYSGQSEGIESTSYTESTSSTGSTSLGTESVNSESISVSTSFPESSSGCKVEISVVGKGVKDKFIQPCSDEPADSISTDDVFIFGDPKVNSFSLYSDEPDVLYVVKNKACTKRTYTTDAKGVTKSKITILKISKCTELRKTISETLAIHQS